MFQCSALEIRENKNKRVFEEARQFIEAWRAESKQASKPYVRVKFLGKNQRVYIDDFNYHIETKDQDDMVTRYRLLPCVKELLKHSTETPKETRDGNLLFEGITPSGDNFNVIIRPGKGGATLQSFYKVRK